MVVRLLVISFFIAVFAFTVHLFIYDILPLYYESDKPENTVPLFTNEKLSQYNGLTKEELYLAILGIVYDVTKSKKHYGPGESYHAFTGRDASQSFITGDFNTNNLSDDISKLSGEELLSLQKWKEFYDKQYIKKGRLIGRYYDSNGNPTEYSKQVEEWIELAKTDEYMREDQKIHYPPCNIEWDAEQGTRVWCTEKSGGILRKWVGYPVKYFEPGSKSHRCACVRSYEDDPSIAFYENCYGKRSCYVKED